MHFDTRLTVQIADKLINTVHSVKTKYDSTHIGSSCDIVVPINSVIEYLDGSHTFLTAYVLNTFKSGDPVTVTAAYITEAGIDMGDVVIFTGFVYEFKEGMPVTIRCIDYLPLLGHLQNLHFASVTLKDLINKVLSGTGITLLLPVLDLTLVNITFRSISPWGVLEYLKKGLGLNISLSGATLFVNLASTTLDVVEFSSDRNIWENAIQQPENVWQGFRVKAFFIKPNGTRDSIEIGDESGHVTDVYFYKVQGSTQDKINLANQALIKCKQRKFSGEVSGYLYPIVKLYDRIDYTDISYPDKSGSYVITALSHDLTDEGFYVRMRWAFLLDNLNVQ